MIDLHMHTNFSDGSDSLDVLLDKVIEKNIEFFSITDHDTALSGREIFNNKTLQNKIKTAGLTYTTGVEWSCVVDEYKIHVLAYDFDPNAKEVLYFEQKIKDLLKQKSDDKIAYIENQGYKFSEKSKQFLNSRLNIRTIDLGNCLVNDGYYSDLEDAIRQCVKKAKTNGTYRLDAREVVKTMTDIGAKVVWAHSLHGIGDPSLSYDEVEKIVVELKKYGLAGLETYYCLYNSDEIEHLKQIAEKNNLFTTCGSDYHGENKTVGLCEVSCDDTPFKLNKEYYTKIFNKNTI